MKKKIVDVDQVLFEEVVEVDKYKKDINLLVTSNRIIFQMKKGLFKKVFKEVQTILFSDIQVLDGKVSVSRKGDTLLLATDEEKLEIIFDDKKRAKEFEVLVVNSVSGTKPFGRAVSKVVGFVKSVNASISPSTKKAIGAALLSFVGAVISKVIEQNNENK